MQQTPFKYLKANIHKVRFNCDDKLLGEYRSAFSRVLDRLDKYFIENKLYQCGDYQAIVENMISSGSNFSFLVEGPDGELAKRHWAGMCWRHDGKAEITMALESLGQGTSTEGMICHEFFHYLTTGQEILKYKKDGKEFEIHPPKGHIPGHKVIIENGKKTTQQLVGSAVLEGGFICEALTELAKQQIYSEEECYFAYTPQTSLINLLSHIAGEDISIADFLRGETLNYVKLLGGETNYKSFNAYCRAFQNEFEKNHSIDYRTNDNYKKAQELVVNQVFKRIQMELNAEKQIPPEEIVRKMSAILQYAPVSPEQYNKAIQSTIEQYTQSRFMPEAQKKKYSTLLTETIKEKALGDTYRLGASNNIVVKQSPTGFAISYKGGEFIDSSRFTKSSVISNTFKLPDVDIKVSLNNNGFYELNIIGKDGTVETVNVMQDKAHAQKIIVSDKENGTKTYLDFETAKKRRDANVAENENLLNNFKHFGTMQSMINSASSRVYNIREITSKSGQKYMVATTKEGPLFIKFNPPNGYERVQVQSSQKVAENVPITEQVRMGTEKTGAIGYLPTKVQTDGDAKAFTLSDGTEFAMYWDNGKIQFAEQMQPFAGQDTKTLVRIDNTSLYSTSNPLQAEMFDTSTFTQGIKRELPHKTPKQIDEERKAEQQERARKAEEARQQENDRRIEEQRRAQRISQEERERRDREIEQERSARRQREQAQQEQFEAKQQKIQEKEPLFDEYGVPLKTMAEFAERIQRNSQSHSYGRGR